eukprot:5587574-Prymnesium_polylepis.1
MRASQGAAGCSHPHMQWRGSHRPSSSWELNDGHPRHAQGRGHGGTRRSYRPPGPRDPHPP